MAPPLLLPRIAIKNSMIQEFYIKKDWVVNVAITSIQRRDNYYSESDKFQPNRWTQIQNAGNNYIPFSIGSR